MLERWGRFSRTCEPGLHFKNPIADGVAGFLTLRVQQVDVTVETKTKDDVFVRIGVVVLFKVLIEAMYEAFYTLSQPSVQIQSYVSNHVRAHVPNRKLDEVFLVKDDIAKSLKADLEKEMNQFGYTIMQTLIVDIEPDKHVKESMNDIQAAQRLRVAALDRAEADKIQIIKAAEADAESKRLSGVGLAEQRKAIVSGLQVSIENFTHKLPIRPKEVMDLLLTNQYYDTLKDISHNAEKNSLFLPHFPSTVSEIGKQIKVGLEDKGSAPTFQLSIEKEKST